MVRANNNRENGAPGTKVKEIPQTPRLRKRGQVILGRLEGEVASEYD